MASLPIVYVPGWGCDEDLFADVIDRVAEIGGPSGGQVTQSVALLGEARDAEAMTAAVLDALPERCALVGASMGGWVAQRVAAAAPEKVERLVLACTWSTPPPTFPEVLRLSNELVASGTWGEDMRPYVLANFSPAQREGPLIDRMLAMLDRIGPDLLVAQADAMLAAPEVADTHPAISAPTLVLAADDDVFFSVAEQRATALSLVACDNVTVGFEVIAGSNHNVTWEKPELFAATVARWCLSPQVRGLEPSA